MNNRISILSLMFMLLLAKSLLGQQPQISQLNKLFNFYEKQNLFNGSVLISKQGKLLLNKGYGYQNTKLKIKNRPQSIFQVYSITKTFTATLILKLIEESKLNLFDKLSKFYPGYPMGDSISIENLLTHTAGIYDYTRGNNMADQSENEFIAFHKTKPLDFTPGTDWSYTNSGYYFLGYIIEKVTGLNYEQAIEKYIFKPLQMQQSGFAYKNLKSINKATGYEIFTKKMQQPAVTYEPPGPFAAGGMYSTVEDLYKYYNGLKTFKILRKETLQKAFEPFKNNYGYGWVIMQMFDKKTVGHSGAGAGFRSNMVQIPEDDICINIVTNTERDLNNIISATLKILYNKPYKIPFEVAVNKSQLEKYKGTYKANENFVIYVSMMDNKLMAQPMNQPKKIIYAEKDNLFYSEDANGYISFAKNSLGYFDTLIIKRDGQITKACKIFPTWGIIGNATTSGWDGINIEMAETKNKGIWNLNNVPLKKGELKFRFNNDWTINLGIDGAGKLREGVNNLVIEKDGIYNIELNVENEEYPSYKIITIKK